MENLKEFVESSKSYKEVLGHLGLSTSRMNYKKIQSAIEKENLATGHFLSNTVLPLEELLVKNSTYCRGNLKRRLYKEGLKTRECELCGQEEEWKGKKMSLILDHINGINNDNRLENIRIVCPNCNATLDTHCGKNVKKKKKVKEKKLLPVDFHVKKNENLRVVERPPYIELLDEITKLGYRGTGKKYGVSDNAVRKWVKAYEKIIKQEGFIV